MIKDRRHKDSNWQLAPADDNGNVSDSTVTNALLMDIRDELRTIRRLLNCHRIPKSLDALIEVGRDIRRKQRAKAKRNRTR